ncbi:virus tail fiber assembly protein lambda gpK [Pantoea ananatis]|uniref:Tail fiber assembly protein n=1 Tax=Pantoea ananas TaxID=553 RepID=A0A8A4K606_PANAN|nr:tail fiber assembly protein [Pantoea ananatis]NQE79310.1 phage tail protein [Pantoea ananatis]NQE83933.1 phage tail protein [Pantoea ananatis]PXW01124.1 virus tail fiber assembly protein lambda gpK [Pantoea ananatis]QTC46862.1 tail fiber assembly protein [Pantoea ananatis]
MLKAQLDKDFIAINAGEISVCNYDGVSREYLSTITEILAKGVGLPANSCIDAPLEKKEGMVVCRTKDLSAWEYINDHRGETVYDIETAKPFIITELGDYPTNATSIVPASYFCKWNGENWVEDLSLKNEADMLSAEKHRENILNSIDETISDWRIELFLGDISDSNKAKLSTWMDYKSAIKAVDVSTAPDVSWPTPPASKSM